MVLLKQYHYYNMEEFLSHVELNWGVFLILIMIMVANTIAGSLHAKTTNTFDKKCFIEHTGKKIIMILMILVSLIYSHNSEFYKFGTLLTTSYGVVEFISFKKHYLQYKKED